jgi:hypothetical protein
LESLVIYCRMYAVLSMEARYSYIYSGEKLNLTLVGQLLRPEWQFMHHSPLFLPTILSLEKIPHKLQRRFPLCPFFKVRNQANYVVM